MFRKKTATPNINIHDENLLDLGNQIIETGNDIERKARIAYLCAESIKCYKPNTPDCATAEKELEEAQYSLLCSIGHYDALCADFYRYRNEHGAECDRSWSDKPESHYWVRFGVERALKR